MHTIHDCSINAGREPFSFTSIGDVDRLGLRFREGPCGPSATESVQDYRRFRMRCLATSLGLLEEAGLPRHASPLPANRGPRPPRHAVAPLTG